MATTRMVGELTQCMKCLKCKVRNFEKDIDLTDVISVNSSIHGLFSLQKRDGLSSILRLKEGGTVCISSSIITEGCKRIFWDSRTIASGQTQTFFVQDEKHTVAEYAISNDSISLQKQLLIHPLKRAIEAFSHVSVSTVQLIGYDRGYLLFLVNSDTLCAAEIGNNACVPCAWIPLPAEGAAMEKEGRTCFQVSSEAVAVLHTQAQLLFIYSLCDGKLLCQVDLEPAGFTGSGSSFTTDRDGTATCDSVWTMTSSLNKFVWICPDGAISILDLERYIASCPHAVRLSDTMQATRSKVGISQTMRTTSRRGGFSWKQALLNLHQLEIHQSTSTPWSCEKIPAAAILQKQSFMFRQTPACAFRGKQVGGAGEKAQRFLKEFRLPEGSLLDVGYRVLRLRCSKFTLVLELVSGADNRQRAICLVDVKTQQVYFQDLPSDHHLVSMTTTDLPMMVMSPSGLVMLVPPSEVGQDDIVSKMMVFGSNQTTDSMCRLNGWGRTTVPVHALELGLRQLQLNTVSFFLRTKEHLFSGFGRDSAGQNFQQRQKWTPDTHISVAKDIIPALDLFLRVINCDLPDVSPPHDFCLRLLVLTLEFVHSLLKDGMVRLSQLGGTEAEMAEKHDLDSALDIILSYVAKLRDAIASSELRTKRVKRAFTQRSAGSRSLGSESADTETLDNISVYTDSVDASSFGIPDTDLAIPEDFTEKACEENNLPQLQAEMISLGHNLTAEWGQLVRAGLQRAWSHVQKRDITATQTIISNLGLDVAGTIWQLSQYSTDRQLQEYVIEQLNAAATLSAEDRSLVDFLQKLYSVYPSSSVKQSFLQKQGSQQWSNSNPFASHLRSVPTNVASEAKDIGVSPTSPSESTLPSYCVMALHWLRQMDVDMKEAMLLEGSILRNEPIDPGRFSPRLLWRFWLLRNEPHRALEALEAAIANEKQLLGSCFEDFVQDLPLSASFVQHIIKMHLLQNRDRLWTAIESLHLTAEEQISSIPGLLHTPHPLLRFGAKVVERFHRQFAAYCAGHGFVRTLWKYCSLHGLAVERLLDVEAASDVLWYKPFIFFHSAVNQTDGADRMFAASLSMASVLWKPDDWTLSQMLKAGHLSAAIATVAYLPEADSILQIEKESGSGVNAELLRTNLQRYPKLLSALLPPDADTSRFDVNLYQLLRDSAPLDTKRLFGWQSTNEVAIGTEDGMKVLPYFSQADLVSRFAHIVKLNFTYYLKHGRPSYAFLSFLTEELPQKSSTLSPKRVHAACGIALWLAVKHFHNSQVSSACVAFVELLGRDSIVLRTYIHAGETLLAHRIRNFSGPIDKRKEHQKGSEQEVVTLLLSCLGRRKEVGRQLLTQVEEAISDEVAREGLSSTSMEAALKWNLALFLCQHLRLPLSSRFLENCARDDRWLPFIWFSQLHQYPKTQLQQILHHFPSRHLRDHLHYIIANASSNTVTSSAAAAPDGKPNAAGSNTDGSRSVRSTLYSKIGVQNDKGLFAQCEERGLCTRKRLYSRVGLEAQFPVKRLKQCAPCEKGELDGSSEEEDMARKQPVEQPSTTDRQHSDEELDLTEETSASDVFRVIFSAMATAEPWKSLLVHSVVLRNPLFAELAGCCGAPMVSSLCGWLTAMLSPSEHARFVSKHGKRVFRWTRSHLEELIEVYLQSHAENTLSAAFFIFQPTSPLLPFLQFIAQCVSWRNYEGCKQPLDTFKDAMAGVALNKSSSSDEEKELDKQEQSPDPAQQVIGERDWLERTAYKVVHYQLLHCPSLYDAVHMLQLLAEENIALVFSFDVLDFGRLHKMVEILHKHHVGDVHLPKLFSASAERQAYLCECQKALEGLMGMEVYEDAYAFGQFAGLDLSAVVLQQLDSEKKHLESLGIWTSASVRHRYWKQCGARCSRFHLPPHLVAEFFQKEADKTDALSEKAAIFQLSLAHVENHQNQMTPDKFSTLRNAIFTQMWHCRLQDRVAGRRRKVGKERKEAPDIFSSLVEEDANQKTAVGREELLHKSTLPVSQVELSNELGDEESAELERVMGELLSVSRVSECCQLARLLGGQSKELTVILTCIGLSTGEIMVETMDPMSRRLLTTAVKRASLASVASFSISRGQAASSISLSSAAPDWSFLPSDQEEVIATMERLLCQCQQSRPCCLRIVSVYKIACLTGRSYGEVLLAEEFSVLRELLKTEFQQRYSLASEFLTTSCLTDVEVASFLVDEIVKSLRIYLGGKDFAEAGRAGKSGTVELIFRPTEGGEVFSQLVSLCGDPAILGDKLLHALAALASEAASDMTQSVLSMVTELLIMSHECHTSACNMEGISNVLRAARVCAQHLVEASQYQLMIRLLTGIGRYSEMTYIFDYLHQHHQFEMLLRKGIDKEDKLKTAILDYLKRFHGDDKDTYSMVALNFSMYREIAQMLEDSGHYNLNLLKDKPIDSSKEMHDTLRKSHQYFKDAAESYVKDQCFDYTARCLKWARLVNLQMQFLGSGVKVIHLTPEEVKAFAASHSKFIEAFMVVEAHGIAIDWSDGLYSHVLLGADMRYLEDFKRYLKLTPTLIESTLHRMKQAPGKVANCAPQIRKLLKMCGDVWLEYKIAQDLGLQDFTKELLRDEFTGGYINDMLNHP